MQRLMVSIAHYILYCDKQFLSGLTRWITDYGFSKAKSQILGYKGLVFCRNNGWIIDKMDKGLTVPKWVLIVWPKIPQIPQNLFSQKHAILLKKKLNRASVVRGATNWGLWILFQIFCEACNWNVLLEFWS